MWQEFWIVLNWQELSTEINNAAKVTFGLVKNKRQVWWNELCEEALAERAKQWKKWKCSGKIEHYEQFKQQRKKAARIVRGTKRSFEKLKLVEIQENFIKNNCRDFYQTIKNKIKGLPLSLIHI